MTDVSIWKERFKITHSLVASDGLASLHGLAYCMQETAINHADAANLGYEDLVKENKAWVLTRQMIKLNDIPHLNDTITIETWANSRTETMVIRDFNIRNKKKECVAIARTSWMLLDLTSRRPVRIPQSILECLPFNPDRLTEQIHLEKIPVPIQEAEREAAFQVVFSDLDLNQHVNNINYLKWVLDNFNYEFRMKFRVFSIETNYLSEALYGDILSRSTIAGEVNEYLTKIVHTNTLKPILMARTNWLPKE